MIPALMPRGPGARPRVVVVDDSPESIDLLLMLLCASHDVTVVRSGAEAIALVCAFPPDLVLLDVYMPHPDGYAVCLELKRNELARHVPVVFMSAYVDAEGEARAFEAGAADCIRKPINERVAWTRIQTQISLKFANDAARARALNLEQEVNVRTRHIEDIQQTALLALACLARTRDVETGGHILRTQRYVRMLADELGTHPRFAGELTPRTIDLITQSAPLHDIGKVGIPDRILRKPGPLTAEEMAIMRTHTTLGLLALQEAERMQNREMLFLRHAKEIAMFHHERWDGGGYPQGLAGTDIPVSARLMALADVYDALISRRVYKAPMPHAEAVDRICACSGSHFDPDVVQAFMRLAARFEQVALEHRDEPPHTPAHTPEDHA